jgi:hypothetical protein
MPASRPAFRLIQGSGFGNAVSFPDRLFARCRRPPTARSRRRSTGCGPPGSADGTLRTGS